MTPDFPPVSSASSPASVRRLLGALAPFLALVTVYALFAVLRHDRFVTWDNSAIMLQQTAVIGMGAIGMTLIVISGGVDLSFGSIIALSAVVLALLLQAGAPPLVAAAGAVGLGVITGVASGLLVTRLRLMPFIVTLGMMGILRERPKGWPTSSPSIRIPPG